MRVQPRWWVGVTVFVVYALWVLAVWSYRDIDYRTLSAESSLVQAALQPLGIAALALAVFNAYAGWWRATMFETTRVRRPGILALLLVALLGFIVAKAAAVDFPAIGARHVAVIAAATLLVGFCEEMVTRGILLVSLRGSLRSEAWVWFASSSLFGLLHATNAFFGVGAAALLQVVLAFCVGTGLYLLRRLSGTLLLPMLVHAAWDFTTLSGDVNHSPTTTTALGFMAGSYLLSLVCVAIVLGRRDVAAS